MLGPIDCLARLHDWGNVPRDVLDALVRSARRVQTSRDEALFRRGDAEPGLFLVASGEYKVSMLSASGREQIVFLVEPGKLITEGFLPTGDHCRASAFARDASSAWQFLGPDVKRVCRGSAELATALASTLAHRSNRMLELVYDLSLRSVEQRVAAFLLYLSRKIPPAADGSYVIPRELNVNTVAGMLGTTREELTRTQSRLQKSNIIAVTRQEVRILDVAAIERLADEDGH